MDDDITNKLIYWVCPAFLQCYHLYNWTKKFQCKIYIWLLYKQIKIIAVAQIVLQQYPKSIILLGKEYYIPFLVINAKYFRIELLNYMQNKNMFLILLHVLEILSSFPIIYKLLQNSHATLTETCKMGSVEYVWVKNKC